MKQLQAEFTGEQGSMGLCNGCTYWVTDTIIDNKIVLRIGTSKHIVGNICVPYDSLNSVLDNWKFF